MLRAEHLAQQVDGLAIQRLGAGEIALLGHRSGQIVQMTNVLRVVLAAREQVDAQRLPVQPLRRGEVAPRLREPRERVQWAGEVLVIRPALHDPDTQALFETALRVAELTLGVFDHAEPAQAPCSLQALRARERAC